MLNKHWKRKVAAVTAAVALLLSTNVYAMEDMDMKDKDMDTTEMGMSDKGMSDIEMSGSDMNDMSMTDMNEMNMSDMMMVPLRKTAEMLGYIVHWDAMTKSVTMTYHGMDDSLAMRMIVLSLKTGAVQINGMEAMEMYAVNVEMGTSYVDNMFVDKVLKGMM